MGIQIHIALNLQAHEGVDVPGQESQAVVGAQLFDAGELVGGTAALEAKVLEYREGSGNIQAVDVHNAGLLDDVVGVIGLVDGHGNPVGGVGDLGNGVHNQTIVLGAVVGGYHIQAVADVEQGGQVVLVGGGVVLSQIVHAQFLSQSLNLGLALIVHGRQNPHSGVGEGQVLAALEHLAHDLGSQRCPGAVLHQSDGAVLEIPLGQVVDKLLHEGEDICVISGGSQHQLAVAESIGHSLGHIAPGQVVNNHLGAALGLQLLNQQLHSSLGIAIDGGVGNHNAFALNPVRRPDVVQIQIVTQILGEHRAVQGADLGNVQTGSLLQQSLNLGAVLADDADIVPTGLVSPVFLGIQSAELAETVSGEQYLVAGIVAHNDFGPVNHGSGDKGQGVLAQSQGAAFANHNPAIGVVVTEEVLHHAESLGGRDNHSVGVDLQEVGNVGGVVHFHVLYHQVVRLAAFQDLLNFIQPFMGEASVHGIHDSNLFVQDDIRVVGHTVGYNILTFEQVYLMVVDTNITDIIGNEHSVFSLSVIIWFMDVHRTAGNARFYWASCCKAFSSRISTVPRVKCTLPSFWKYRSIRVTTSRAVPMWLAIFSWVIFRREVPSSWDSSSKKAASRLSKLFHIICSMSHITSEKRLLIS